MRTQPKNPLPRLALTRHFESSRHQGADLVTAFERALPIVRRTVGRSPRPCLKLEYSSFPRRAGS
jgi:hypothetical protein